MQSWWKFVVGFSIAISILIATNAAQTKTPRFEGAILDIVLLLDESSSMDNVEHQKMLNVIRKLPYYFPIGDKKSHVAAVAFASAAILKHVFTDNVTVFDNFINNAARTRQGHGNTHTAAGLAMIRDVVLPTDKRPNVTNVIIIFTDGCTVEGFDNVGKGMEKAVKEANKLLARGCVIYLVHTGENYCEGVPELKPMPHQLHLVGNVSTRRLQYDNFDKLSDEIFQQVKKEFTPPDCNDTEVCYYADDDKKVCVGHWDRSNATGCAQTGEVDCNIDKCEMSCKSYWLDVNGACSKWCSKPASEPCKTCFRCRSQPKTSAISAISTIAIATGTPTPLGGRNDDKKNGVGKSDSDSYTQWIYIGVAIGVGLLLVMLLVFAFVVVRKRRQRRKHIALMRTKSEIGRGVDSSISKSKSKSESKSQMHVSGSRKSSTKHGRKSLPSNEPTTHRIHSKVTGRTAAVLQNEKPAAEKFRPSSRARRQTLSFESRPKKADKEAESKKHHQDSSPIHRPEKKMRP